MATKEDVRQCWRKAEAVCFDVDSTVCMDEGLDELAGFCGKGAEVQELTKKAMGGNLTFREALTVRLNIVQPTENILEEFIKAHPPKLSPGIKELIHLLGKMNRRVFLVSGGFRKIIAPVAAALSLPVEHIYANNLLFNKDGSYAGFDYKEPTSESGGKPRVIQLIKDKYNISTLVMIGDGATDMEACPPASAFIGYGGNVVREKVKSGSAWFVTDFQELIDELQDVEQS